MLAVRGVVSSTNAPMYAKKKSKKMVNRFNGFTLPGVL
jgi:hypothetical protein